MLAHFSLDPSAAAAKCGHSVLPQSDPIGAGPSPYFAVVVEVQEAKIIGYDLMPAPCQGGSQSRFTSALVADEGDATIRYINDR
jgi:hypothetical protein